MIVDYRDEIDSYAALRYLKGNIVIIENGKKNNYEKYSASSFEKTDWSLGRFGEDDSLETVVSISFVHNSYYIIINLKNFDGGYFEFDFPEEKFYYFPSGYGSRLNMGNIEGDIHKYPIKKGLFKYFNKIAFRLSDYLDKDSFEYQKIMEKL